MTIQNYLLANHLKPLFIYRFESGDNREAFGVFVGTKKPVPTTGDNDFKDLIYDHDAKKKPKWANETPLWIIPLSYTKEENLYKLRYNDPESPDKDLILTKQFNSCYINIVNQAKCSDWNSYNDFLPEKSLEFSHYLNFQGSELSLSEETPFTRHTILEKIQEKKDKVLTVWLTDSASILTTTKLLHFKGIQCDIVDMMGKKHDFGIWVGIREKKHDGENKIVLSINLQDEGTGNQAVGTDCPIIWRKKGLLDDTIFPNKNTNTFSVENNKLSLKGYTTKNKYLSYNLAKIDYDEVHTPLQKYNSWFIKEGNIDGNGQNLSPFFKYVHPKVTAGKLVALINKKYAQVYFFQINRFNQNPTRHIISWIPGGLNRGILDIFENTARSRSNLNRSGQESISPILDKFIFSNLNQIVSEHIILNEKVSFKYLRLFNNPPEPVISIDKLDEVLLERQSIKLPNFRLSDFNRKNLITDGIEYELTDYFDFESFNFTSEGIGRELDNGTFFGFKVEAEGTQKATKEGIFNDGSFAFTLDNTQKVEGRIYFSLQLQKAQKPFYFWEWHEGLEGNDSIIPCFSIEDFKLPVSLITPLSSDLSQQDRFIADDDSSSLVNSGTIRPILPLIIPIFSPENSQKYYLSLSENINVGQDYNFSVEIEVNNFQAQQDTKKAKLGAVVLGTQPQTALKIETPFGTDPQQDNGKWIVARKNNLSADGGVWEILNEAANETGITVTFPPQIIGEAFRKTNKENDITIIKGEPEDTKEVQFKFGPPAQLQIANEQLNRQMVTAPWNLHYLFGNYGDSSPGRKLLKAQFELLYGLNAHFENKDAFIAELENKLGQLVKAPRGRIVWQSDKEQNEAFEKAYSDFIRLMALFNSRLAIYEVSGKDKFQPAKFTEGIDYYFRVENNEGKIKGAKLKWPFVDKKGNDLIPDYLEDIYKNYHADEGLTGGFNFGFESMAVYKELWGTGLQKGSSSGEIENLAFSSQGGYGKIVARFNNDKTIIKSTTSLGRTHFYAVERIGRIGVFWNKAKHVIEYERTVVPSKQFRNTENVGRVIMRKVREFVEILEPERNYPEFGAEPSSAGSILGTRFKSKKIPVSSSWGRDVSRRDQTEPIGWEVPLWNPNADKSIYLFPQIMLSVLASKESQLTDVLCNLVNPENLYFYTDTRPSVGDKLITAATDEWPSVLDVDYTLQPFEHIYLKAEPCLNKEDSKLVNTPLPSPVDVLPGFERYTFRIVPSDVLISANGAYNKDSQVVGKLRTVTMQRQPVIKKDKDIIAGVKLGADAQKHIPIFHNYLSDKAIGYKEEILTNPAGLKTEKIQQAIASHFSMAHKAADSFEEIFKNFNQEPKLKYLNLTSFNSNNVNKIWEIPTTALWFQLTREVDEGIGAIDKNFNLLFGEVRKEFLELHENATQNLKEVVLDRITFFKNNITDLNSHIDINLNGLGKLLNTETDKIDAYLLREYTDIQNKLSDFLATASAAIDAIPDPATTLAQFKAKVNSEIEAKVAKQIDDIFAKIKVNNHIKDKVRKQVEKQVDDKVKAPISDFLQKLDTKPFSLEEAKAEIKTELNKIIKELAKGLDDYRNILMTEVGNVALSIEQIVKDFRTILKTERDKVIAVITGFEDQIKAGNAEIITLIEDFFKPIDDNKFVSVKQITDAMIPSIQDFLIKDYKKDDSRKVPPLAHLFDQGDQWLKSQITDFKTLVKNLLGKSEDEIKKTIEENFDQLKEIYAEIADLENLVDSRNTDAIIKKANELSKAISEDFGKVIGDVTRAYYEAVQLKDVYKDLEQEFETTLFNYRSVFEEIKAVDLGFNRQTIELVFNFNQTKAPRLLLTPVMGKLQKLNDGLNSMGVTMPYAALEERFVAPLKEWGNDFAKSFSHQFPISNLLNDLGGIKFDKLFPFLKGNDAFMKAVKITHDLDKEALKAWVRADVNYTFAEDNTFMNIGPVKVTMLRNAVITAQAYESLDIDRNRKSENTGSLRATFKISLSGAPLMLFRDTVVSFKNGKYDFDLDPSRMEMPGLLKVLTDASQNIKTSAPADDKNGSPFKLELIKISRDIGGKKLELPIGAKATLDLPPLSIGGGPTSMSNLSFGGNFIMKAIDDSNLPNLKLDFMVGLGFYFGKRDLPFNFTAFILGGGGFIDCNFRYKPSVSGAIQVNFIMSVHASAAFSLSAGWISGTIMILAGIEVEYTSGTGGGTRIEIFIAIIGVVDILGLISIYLALRLSINYLSDGNGTVLYGVGTVKCKIKICSFVTIKVSKSHTQILKGESKSVSNGRSESISASLN
ncbi:hypothetical protein LZD49_34625 [Dyadobacter sp. CY261]|uniref:hypothetical protein n=1 Tax=Dyadobacter sp. CY261 TaxID=2907203 RepID=UPI001F47B59B|nr:hypothetical protein [Dyadobacter sp. CY261]MCF0075659.1 hypothetical protein [Dyadobacter sp. CY261]